MPPEMEAVRSGACKQRNSLLNYPVLDYINTSLRVHFNSTASMTQNATQPPAVWWESQEENAFKKKKRNILYELIPGPF